jgi:hypothetical protein
MLSEIHYFIKSVNYFFNIKIENNKRPVNVKATNIPFQSNSLLPNGYIPRKLLIKIQYIFLVLLQTRYSSSL